MRRLHVVLLSLLIGLTGAAVPLIAQAGGYGPGSLVKDVPVAGTPHVLDGRVYSVVQVGNTIILGGTFTQTRNNSSQTVIARNRLVAFDATTKEISTTFNPSPNGAVNVVLPTGDGETVYVGGSFTTIGGQSRTNLAKVRVSDGAVVTAFNAGSVAGQVKDLRLSNNRLWVAGAFTHIAGKAQKALATVNPTTGAFDTFMRLAIAGLHNGGYTAVGKMDVNPAGTRLIAMGNFDTLAGVKNHQLFQLDLSGAAAAASTFRTNFYESACSASFDSYMRDVDYSPDGSFFVVSTTGAYGGAGTACDSTARFETAAVATARPSWVNNTGGDTTYAVEITDSVVYTGGHARWQNNPFRGDSAGQGAVPRPGIAALDPINGLPLSWNPTRSRGVGVFDFLVTSQGLWVASDTDRIGANYLRSRIALLPVGGTQFPGVKTPSIPNDIYAVRSTGIDRRSYNGTTVGAAQTVPTGGMTTNNVRGSFMLNGWLYIAWSNGTFDRRTFDGTNYGTPIAVDTSSELTAFTDWTSDIQQITGMFYDSGRLYFTKSNSSTLFYRHFTPESDVVGAERLTASGNVSGIDFSQVRGMFVANDNLYWSTSSGDLRRLGWAQGAQSGKPVAGAYTVVSSPAVGGVNWSSPRALFLYQAADGDGAVKTPVADFTYSCTELACSFTGAEDPNAPITSYEWNFGDGTTGTGRTVSRTYGSPAARNVTLTVRTAQGGTATTTKSVNTSVAGVQYVDAASTNSNYRANHTVKVPSTVQVGDTLLAFVTINSTNVTLGDMSGWTQLQTASVSGLQSRVWTRTATAADLGSTLSVASSGPIKSSMTVSAHRPSGGGTLSVATSNVASSGAAATSLTTPTVNVAQSGSWLVSYWGVKSSNAVTFSTPGGQQVRSDSVSTGTGNISARLTDTGQPVPSGSNGGVTAGTGLATSRAAMFSIVIEAH